jgi:hypothetical protein
MVVSCCGASLAFRHNGRLRRGWRRLCGLGLILLSAFGVLYALSTISFGGPFVWWRFRWLYSEDDYCDQQRFHDRINVSQKYLTANSFRNTFISMANVLSA